MRLYRSVQILTGLATVATLGACTSYGRHTRSEPDPSYSASVSVQWESGPLDQAYGRERTDMDARHTQEIASPRANESSDQRSKRQDTEKQGLERRYAQGKASHSHDLPPSDR
jgi:hypothetical protein